jgi:hypothetical protein
MANEEDLYHEAQARLERLRQDAKIHLDTLEARLENAVYPGERDAIQLDINKLEKVFDRAIETAQFNATKAEAEYLAQKAVKDAELARQQAALETQLKNDALKQFILAGGSPDRFEEMWPQIRQVVITERVVDNLTRKPTEPQTIHL